MKELPLAGAVGAGLVALVDDEDYERLACFRWSALRPHRSLTIYVRATIHGRHRYLHQEVLGDRIGFEIDHEDGNGLNCQKANLRHLTHSHNVKAGNSRRAYDAWKVAKAARSLSPK